MAKPSLQQALCVLILSLIITSPLLARASDPDEATQMTLDQSVYFTGTDGSVVIANPGIYSVEVAQEWLKLIPGQQRRDALLVETERGTHEVNIGIPIVLSTPGGEPDEMDVHVVQWLNPDGTSLVATGTYSGIQSRGFFRNAARKAAARARAVAEKARRAAAKKSAKIRAAALKAKRAAELAAKNAAAKIRARLGAAPIPKTRGPNAFTRVFKSNAVGYSPSNAYLLTYLATLIYPDFLDQLSGDPFTANKSYVKNLHKKPQAFVDEYAKYTRHLFWDEKSKKGPSNQPPQFVWLWGNRGGQDPEAMVISTPKTILVVFRGTDRVGNAKKKSGYTWNEWLHTNFVALGVAPKVRGLRGKVHAGFWYSLTAPTSLYVPTKSKDPSGLRKGRPFRDAVLDVITAFEGKKKKIWVVGHSLGAAHVQLFSAYLNARGYPPQGVYALAAPHVGDSTFVKQLDGMFPPHRLQRFEFIHDPVTKVPPKKMPQPDGSTMTFARAGTRVYYNNVHVTRFNASERSATAETARLAGLLLGGGALGGLFATADFCYHYPQWYLMAAYRQLPKGEVRRIPSPLPTPVMKGDVYSKLCGPLKILRGNGKAK